MGIAEIPNWLKGLPLAPEFRPTDTEFADPIAYISKIEKEASAFGICKVIPPLPKPSKKYVLTNLNKSLAKCPELGSDLNASKVSSDVGSGGGGGNDGENRAVFTTRHQELGQSGKKTKGPGGGPLLGVHKQVWQSGEVYTLEQFESKSKVFAKSLLGGVKEVSPLVVEAMFWKASSDKPIYIEYANDVPGSGFGEPESPVKYFHRRRRKRMHYQRSRESYDYKGNHMDGVVNSCDNVMEDVPVSKKSDILLEAETPKLSAAPSNLSNDETPSSSRRKRSNSRIETEGTAGWKLSNSPWNLQVIARSPGSLTRFMPDDIPGVTSPMVYIGMLFSWFAWHVEDHELHSMNFLHTGSAKTWYAVPGDYAFAFEEVIRNEAYGGNIDHLAALALLGEKTTLLSPEVVVASGIPCCRLIQNPGEFVVTFPRAYHIGFSHGFNCGEAANFGTPQWLNVAKEAAVRRAAMNYLPMLSHRQLLYLLTMSFVCRVPRSLLPGARSSRLRDRQKEEREVLVKKAFIEDMLNENNLLNVLLSKKSTYQAVVWDPDLLPSSNQESLLSIVTATTTPPPPRENVPHIHSGNNCSPNNAFDESLYMGTLDDLYLDDYDLSCDFQVDTGTLACVACGILGFPFMSVVQPSALSSDQILVQGSGTLKSPSIHSSPNVDCAAKGPISENISHDILSPKCPAMHSIAKYKEEWNASSGFVRPRIFCLDHAVQIEELLRFKGGANVLVICHTDYQKIKAHAASIAEEIGLPFNYVEIPLDKASQEDLNLIDLAIDGEEHKECGEDWTSKLGINLRHCIRVSKNSPSKQVQHALALDGLFTEKCSSSEFVNMKWNTQRSRSKLKLNRPVRHKLCEGFQMKDELLGGISVAINVKIEQKVIQYKRRKFKSKPGDLAGTSRGCDLLPRKPLPQEVSVSTCLYLDKHDGNLSENHSYNVQMGTTSSRLCCSASTITPQLQDERVLEATMEKSSDTDPAHIELPLLTTSTMVGNVEAHVENQILEGMDVESRSQDGSEMEKKIKVSEQISPVNEISCATKYASSLASARPTGGEFEKQEDNEISKQVNIVKVTCKMAIGNHPEGQHSAEAGGDVFIDEVVSDITNPAGSDVKSTVIGGYDGQMEKITVVANSCTQSEVSFSSEGQQELYISTNSGSVETVSTNVALMLQPTASVEKVYEVCSETLTGCDGLPAEQGARHEMKTTNRSNKETILNDIERMNQPLDVMEDESDFPRDSCATDDLNNCKMLDDEVQQEILRNGSNEKEIVLGLVKQTEVNQSTPVSVEDSSGVSAEAGPEEILCSDMALNHEIQHRIQITNISKEEPASSYDATLTEQPASVSVKECSDVQRESHAALNLHDGNEGSSHENKEQECTKSILVYHKSTVAKGRKRRREVGHHVEDNCDGFIRGPCEGLRPRAGRDGTNKNGNDVNRTVPKNDTKPTDALVSDKGKQKKAKESHRCDVEGCRMSFRTKGELLLHKSYRCPLDGCRKRFRSHKYAVLHQRVHDDERPLKCPWEGCSMSFKWAWARTEHIRLHTGERPYECKVEGCGRSFRFVSDYSRHRRKMGHYVTSPT